MKRRFLGIISLLYVLIILYLWCSNNLVNILAPQMQVYVKLSLIPLLLIGLVFLLNNNIKYKFKVSDLVLLLPLIMIILSGDFRLTSKLATNRDTLITKEDSKIDDNYKEDEIDITKYNFESVDFDVIDPSYGGISDYLMYTTDPDYYIGKTIRFRGLSLKNSKIVSGNYFIIGKYLITCCAADAGFVGFVVNYDVNEIKDNTWYEVEGVLKKVRLKDGTYVVGVKVVNIKEIDSKSENQYVYPCYTYSDVCEEISKYNLK
ncbi:MAG: DUF1980 domain-containing protein [Bacilli bacterium]|nr:DUF1980 domain-containing protein [Bacilli bacterium]